MGSALIDIHTNDQKHLDYKQRVNLGSYYTQNKFVQIVWQMIKPYLTNKTVILDNSCGYGNFLNHDFEGKKIGNDIDLLAIKTARKQSSASFFNINSLKNISREKYNIKKGDNVCIIGNPPYNDKTSIIRNNIKSFNMEVDNDVKTRDLGMSFLLSYQKLNADTICVLHPLSYLIKKSNFNTLEKFCKNYKLISGIIISSNVFSQASKSIQFPIVIALYRKNKIGMVYEDIKKFSFKVLDGYDFSINNFDNISNYIAKYPNKYKKPTKNSIMFWTMRDINALKRNQTFVKKYSSNVIIIDKSKLDYYIYVDVFKQFTQHIPYYFGNCDVIINNDLFKIYRKYFILESLSRHLYLRPYFADFDFSKSHIINYAKQQIQKYLQDLLSNHYVY